jgi:tetratricopeptide (TPR) repeat protein
MLCKNLLQKFTLAIRTIFASVLLVSCATGPTQYAASKLEPNQKDFVAGQPAELQAAYRKLLQEGRRNEVLNLMEIGALAFKTGHFKNAKRILDQAIGNIESVYADNEAARKARSLWYEEGEKDFKGEPYERAMAYYYRGLIYLKDGDYGNARATFLSGLLQDAFAEEEQFSADFALLVYLAGWAAKLDGNERLASEHFTEFKQFRPDAPIPRAEDNILIVAETGTSPRKLADGVGHYELVYRRGKNFTENRAQIAGLGLTQDLYPAEDIFVQASTRGGRAVDRIIENKVAFKKTAENIGTSLTSLSENSTLAGIAAGAGGVVSAGFNAITLIGVAAEGLSARAKTRADTRYWASLPDTVHIASASVPLDSKNYSILFSDKQGVSQPPTSKPAHVYFDTRGNGLIFASAR